MFKIENLGIGLDILELAKPFEQFTESCRRPLMGAERNHLEQRKR
jgi:hypothetical protein